MFRLHRMSFRQLLLAAFLSIAGLLAAVSLRGLFALEDLIAQSRAASAQAVALNEATQVLAERGVAMERAARQFMVLDDAQLRRSFDEARADATAVLDRRLAPELPPPAIARWREQLTRIAGELDQTSRSPLDGDSALTPMFRELEAAAVDMATRVRLLSESRNEQMQEAFEAGRVRLGQQVLAAIAVAALAALGFGWWLSRPLVRLEEAVVGLGENRLDQPVQIAGPSDLRSLGQRLEWLRLRLQELDEDKARFLRHVSHELKTPLAALREGVALLQDEVAGTLSDDQREVADILAQNTHALQAQIEDLLRFNAVAFEARRLVRRRTDLLALLQASVDAQRLQWQARQLRVTVEGEPVQAEVDADKLGTVVGNLLSNAIRFSPAGADIRLLLAQRPGWVTLDVVDQGSGVDAGDRERLFEPFYRGQNQPEGALRGSGIGLSIVREYVQAHGGRVQFLHDGPGAHFRIELPHAAD
jgi:two-component system, NtrC family, sensor histidine kinase GlrK